MSYRIEVRASDGSLLATEEVTGDERAARRRANELANQLDAETATVYDVETGHRKYQTGPHI